MHENGTSLRGTRGFTLIELLGVVAIISILLTLTIPMVSRGLVNARRTRCAANLNQLGVSIIMYTDHNPRNTKGYLPPLQGDGNWVVAVTNYMKDSAAIEVLTCPSREHPRKSLSYSGNPRLFSVGANVRPRDILRPEVVIMAADGPQASGGGDAPLLLNETKPFNVMFRHEYDGRLPAANFVFADGHVEPITENSIQSETVDVRIRFDR